MRDTLRDGKRIAVNIIDAVRKVMKRYDEKVCCRALDGITHLAAYTPEVAPYRRYRYRIQLVIAHF
jgi:hypothetical protein